MTLLIAHENGDTLTVEGVTSFKMSGRRGYVDYSVKGAPFVRATRVHTLAVVEATS